ncbi:MAG: shikimate dehydrogenase [Desulfamplus sp.]|nr:shikimate dehydrogenase [Desulfamplus sp.]
MVKLITPATKIYCIFGKPVSHSMSPLIHNMLFNKFSIDAVYLAFEIDDIKHGVDAIRNLGIKGASITIPFKEAIIAHLDEIDETARQIGAVNTVINNDGYLWGCNTDCAGAVEPLKEALSGSSLALPEGLSALSKGSLDGKNVYIIGAGGAARAVAFGIKKEGGNITIVNRSQDKGEQLALQVNGKYLSLLEFNQQASADSMSNHLKHIDIIINTTSVGMTPNIDQSPVSPQIFHKNITVMDIVYNPLKTKLLRDAENAGAKIVDGLSMFIHQGAAQFELFTGIKPPRQIMRDTVIKKMLKVPNQ